uniref:Global nitrogen transcriptional regulator n=1 Tax=Sphondylothamnion multifidum TaxID=193186 RepID=A0A4D6WZC5_9FLOR|nr:global nitrogen transcriptional regulator [Sphondylothamnion multifidum]
MQYINYFSNLNISYYIYKLNKGDSIIETYKKNKNTFIILSGTVCLTKIFNYTNKLCIAVLNQNHIIDIKEYNDHQNYYYKILAIEK